MTVRSLLAFVIALAVWLVYFYVVDWLVMGGQGLAVTWTLMPAS